MTTAAQTGSDKDHGTILARMLEGAEVLCASDDALLVGQYQHLRARIRALMELRLVGEEPGAQK